MGNALMNLSDANKQFLRAGGGQENAYLLDEAYSVGMWAIGKYTEFLRKRARISTETPRKHQDSQRASLRLRELYGSCRSRYCDNVAFSILRKQVDKSGYSRS